MLVLSLLPLMVIAALVTLGLGYFYWYDRQLDAVRETCWSHWSVLVNSLLRVDLVDASGCPVFRHGHHAADRDRVFTITPVLVAFTLVLVGLLGS